MKRSMRSIGTALIVSTCVAFAAPTVFAQEHGEVHATEVQQGGHAEHHVAMPGHEAAHQGVHGHMGDEHVEHGAGHGGAHHPGAINWMNFSGTHTDEHGEVKKNPPPFISTLINFLILAGIVGWAISRKVNPALAERRAAIEAEMSEAQRLRAEAEAMHREYAERVARMEGEFAQMREEFRKAGQAEHDRILTEARQRAERMDRDAELTLQQEVRQLRADLLKEAVQSAAESAERAVRSNVGPADQSRLADDYLAQIERGGVKGARA